MTIKEIQRKLLALGYDLGPSKDDGAWGRLSIAAMKAFQTSKGLEVTGMPTPSTMAYLDPAGPILSNTVPVWYAEAQRLKGVRETAGKASNPVITGWAKSLGGWVGRFYKGDDIPWCGLFVAHCLGATLPEEPLPGNPLSALAWGSFGVPLTSGHVGAVAVFKRPGGGHVGFYVGEDATAIHVLGGNQSDAVTVARVAKSRLVGLRWPAKVLPPSRGVRPAPVLRADTPLSANEA